MNEQQLAKNLSEEDHRMLDSLLVSFDQAWTEKLLQERVDALPPTGSPVRMAALIELIKIDIERQWQRGNQIPVEEYLTRYPELVTPETVPTSLIQAEYEVRCQFGAALQLEELCQRFPAHASELEQLVADSQAKTHRQNPNDSVGSVAFTQVGQYRIQEKIGQGGMGIVYRAHDSDFHRTLAIKFLKPNPQEYPELVRRFQAEAEIMGRLQHPGIPPVHDRGELEDSRPYFTMKLIQGKTLTSLLQEQPAGENPRTQLLGVFEQVCQTLAYAHSQGIIHRDLKPANIMVGAFGEVQVMDWGLVKDIGKTRHSTDQETAPPNESNLQNTDTESQLQEDETALIESQSPASGFHPHTALGQKLGTPGYMPPEQARGEIDRLDERSDVFSLGAILCVILTDKPPFTGNNLESLFQQTVEGNLESAFSRLDACRADPELVRLAKSCLSPQPDNRPDNAGVVADAVETYQTHVQQRLRQAESDKAAAEVQVEEERKRRVVEEARAEEERRRREAEEARVLAERRRRRASVLLMAAVLVFVLGAGGIVGWFWNAETVRAAKAAYDRELAEQQIREALLQANETSEKLHSKLNRKGGVFQLLDQPGAWQNLLQTTRAALTRAQDLENGAPGEIDPDLHDQIKSLGQKLRQDETEYTLAKRLDHVRKERAFIDIGNDIATGSQALDLYSKNYSKAFASAGLLLQQESVETLARKIRNFAIREQLLAALDDWAGYSLNMPKTNEKLQQRLMKLARTIDPHPVRDTIRNPKLWNNPQDLKRFAEDILQKEAELEQISPQMFSQLGARLSADIAEAWMREGQHRYPNDFWINWELGKKLHYHRQSPEALTYYQVALAIRPNSSAIYTDLGEALWMLNRRVDAEKAFRKAQQLDPKYAVSWMGLGRLYRKRGLHEKAFQCFKKATQLNAKYPFAWNALGVVTLENKKKSNEAIKYFKSALGLAPGFYEARVNLGDALVDTGQFEEGVAELNKAIRRYPNLSPAYISLGLVLRKAKKYDRAIRVLQQAIKAEPKNSRAHYSLGVIYKDRNQLSQAIAAYRKAIAYDPSDFRAWNNLANHLADQGDFEEAIKAYRKAVELKPENDQFWNNLGNTLLESQNVEGAIVAYKRAVKLNSQSEDAWYGVGNSLLFKKDYKEAIEAYDRAIESNAKYDRAWANKGVSLWYLSKYEQAVPCFEKAIRENLQNAVAHHGLATALIDHGKFPQALEANQRALKRFPSGHQIHSSFQAQRKEIQALLALDKRLQQILRRNDMNLIVCGASRVGLFASPMGPSLLFVSASPTNRPADNLTMNEALALASLCLRNKHWYRDAVAFYEVAFAQQPKLAEGRPRHFAYEAASAALKAAWGNGHRANDLTASEKEALRQQAYRWLNLEISSHPTLIERNPLWAQDVEKDTEMFRTDPTLNFVKAPKHLAKLPKAEQEAWRGLWSKLETIREQARRSYTEVKFQGHVSKMQQQRIHPWNMMAGKTYSVEMQSKQFTPFLRLEDTEGKKLSELVHLFRYGKNSRLIFSPKKDGVYHVVATSIRRQGQGNYTLLIREFPERSQCPDHSPTAPKQRKQ